MKIVVCDDEYAPRQDWVEAIGNVVGAENVSQLNDDKAQLKSLLNRRHSFRETGETDWAPSQVDEADVLIVDYDLTLIDKDARHTGEEVARLARMYSDCGYIIVMNQYPGIGFDLTMKGHLESYADVNIDSSLAGCPALWSTAVSGEFHPWHWDCIEKITESRRALAEELTKRGMGTSIVDFLQMPNAAIDRLADSAFAFISPATQKPDELAQTTVAEFLQHLTEKKDLEKLADGKPANAARTAVSRLAKWVSRTIVGPQDVLIDVPHLLVRLPYVANKEHGVPSTIEDWNALLDLGAGAICPEIREKGEFRRSVEWIGKATFWWSCIEGLDLVDTLREEFDYESLPDMVFCEDVSRFVPREDATDFRAGFHNFFDRRYVKIVEGVEYAPRRRLAFAEA
ncbi:hypothetical protein [Sphingomonas panni]|uniref:hypothetical protein n=1 Tax=Sphingomonas panni TaxID=237612 RepID=UPI001F5BEF67|nr:hypothetical protein [Sphingomonas panni]